MTKTVLSVDDSASSRHLMACALKPYGYTVVQAVDGIDGLSKMRAQKIDVVVTDVNMPRMNGIEMTRAIRADASFDGVPIILLTAKGQKEKMHKCKVAGAAAWICKPLNAKEICEIVKKVVG